MRLFKRSSKVETKTGGAYSVSGSDSVRTLPDLPASSVGAPLPCVLAGEHCLWVAYLCERRDPEWDGTYIRVVSTSDTETVCVVRFDGPYAHFFGPPNDEAFRGHPLAERGLKPYSAFEINPSSWIRSLERMNSVHPQHRPERFDDYRHFALTFHDTTFECVARGYSFQVESGNLQDIVGRLCASL